MRKFPTSMRVCLLSFFSFRQLHDELMTLAASRPSSLFWSWEHLSLNLFIPVCMRARQSIPVPKWIKPDKLMGLDRCCTVVLHVSRSRSLKLVQWVKHSSKKTKESEELGIWRRQCEASFNFGLTAQLLKHWRTNSRVPKFRNSWANGLNKRAVNVVFSSIGLTSPPQKKNSSLWKCEAVSSRTGD